MGGGFGWAGGRAGVIQHSSIHARWMDRWIGIESTIIISQVGGGKVPFDNDYRTSNVLLQDIESLKDRVEQPLRMLVHHENLPSSLWLDRPDGFEEF